MGNFVCGLMVGAIVSSIVCTITFCSCVAASDADKQAKRMFDSKDKE